MGGRPSTHRTDLRRISFYRVAARALHEAGDLARRVSLPGQAAQPLAGRLDELVVVQAAVRPAVEHLEHQPHALGAQLLAGDHLRGAREVRLQEVEVEVEVRSSGGVEGWCCV